MSKLVNLTMFRGYVNKVLPTVYDDSLSYYEVLAKVMEKINEIINLDNAQNEIINNIPEDVSEFAEELAQFKSSMTQQFNDFKTEINADFDAFEAEVNAKVAADSTPTQSSTKLITSGGVYASLQDIINSLVKDARPTEDSTNYVTSGGVWKAINDAVESLEATLATKQNALTWDTTPTANSTNPVQSGGIKSYVDNAKQAALDILNNYITTNDNRVSGIEGDITDLETGKQDSLTFDLAPTLGSNNPVTSNGIAQALAGVTPSIEVDPVPTQGSTNPVSSNGVYVAVSDLETELEEDLADKQDTLIWDTTPTKNSQNPVTSGGLFEKFAQIDPYGTVDPEPEQGSPNAVSSGGTWTALQTLNNDLTAAINTKQDTLTFDSVPTEDSENPVYSGGVFTELEGKQDTLTFDSAPTEDSENPVYSGGVFAELALKADKTETAEYPIASTTAGINPTITDSADGYVQSLTIYGRSDTVEGELRGIGEDGELEIKTCGKNFITDNNYYGTSTTINGITFTRNSDGSIYATGTATAEATYFLMGEGWSYSASVKNILPKNKTYIMSGGNGVGQYIAMTTYLPSGSEAIPAVYTVDGHDTFSIPNIDNIGYLFYIRIGKGQNVDFTFRPQVELGSTATAYEPHVSSTATVTTGIPLYAVGDVKDELDEKKCVVVKRCEKTTEQGEEIIVPLATPVEIPLTASELSALRNLRTYASTTNVTVTDSPTVDISYLRNTGNGEAIAQLEDKINAALDNKQNTLTFDDTPTASSTNPVTSGGVYTALAGKQDTLTWDNAPTEDSSNAISSGVVYNALQNAGGIQRTLIYDDNLQKDPTQNVIFTQNASNFDEIEIEYWEYQDEGDHGVLPFSTKISKYYLSTAPAVYVGEYNVIVTLVGTAGHYSTYDVASTGLTYNTANTGNTKVVPIRVYGINY